MRPGKEVRQVLAQFLNGLAVAVLATMVLAPFGAGTLSIDWAIVATAAAGILHGLALRIAVVAE
jgi:hypothetical protein